MLTEPAWEAMFDRMAKLDVLNAIHPALPWDEAARQRLAAGRLMTIPEGWRPRSGKQEEQPLQPATIYLSWLIVLKPEEAASAAARLRLPGWMSNHLQSAIQLWQASSKINALSPSETVALMDKQPLLALLVCYYLADSDTVQDKITAYFERWQKIQPMTSGHDLRKQGISPGPHYRQVLTTLRAAWLDNKINSLEEEQSLLAELLAELPTDD
jgi:tRNA nucleotidyltransferase (CCA-adding enzyme)